MDLFLKEHGKALLSAVIGGIVISMTITALIIINVVMPVYSTCVSRDSSEVAANVKRLSPTITTQELVYAQYKSDFDPLKYVKATDFTGSDITARLKITGEVDTLTRGLYVLNLYVENSINYCAKGTLRVMVE